MDSTTSPFSGSFDHRTRSGPSLRHRAGSARGSTPKINADEVATGTNPRLADTDDDSLEDDVDNCPSAYNPSQEDVAGIGTATPDGVGDLCQNADFNDDGEVDILDITLVRRAAVGLEPDLDRSMPPAPEAP